MYPVQPLDVKTNSVVLDGKVVILREQDPVLY